MKLDQKQSLIEIYYNRAMNSYSSMVYKYYRINNHWKIKYAETDEFKTPQVSSQTHLDDKVREKILINLLKFEE